MDVPALYCGVAADVRKVVRKQVRAYIRGAPWLEAIDGPMVSSADVPGLIYLEAPGMAGAPKRPHIYMYLPYLEVFRAVVRGELPASKADELRELSLRSDWGAAVMLGGVCGLFYVLNPACWPCLLRVALDRWAILDGEGPRYTAITEVGRRLWSEAGGLHCAMRGLGLREYPRSNNVVFEPRSFLAEHGLLDRVLAATARP